MPLDSLPAELLLHILSITPSITALFALATTCRRLYSLFHSSQATLLYSVLAAELGPVLPDAFALAHIEVLDGSRGASRARYIAGIDAALDAYGGYLAGDKHDVWERGLELELDEVLRLVRTYRTVGWVAGLYEKCMMGLFDNEVRPACSGSEESARAVVAPLSSVERLRVLRAFYRLQMARHIWGSSAVGSAICNDIAPRVNKRLFGLWEIWEVQQVFGAATFYQRFRSELGRSCDHIWFDSLTCRFCCFDQFRELVAQVRAVDEGLWREALSREGSFPSGTEAAGNNEVMRYRWFPGHVVTWCRTQGPITRHKFPVLLRFNGDCVDRMPFGWVDAFDGYYGYNFWELIGEIRHKGSPTQGLWCRLGFVMWDQSRVEGLKTASFLSDCATGWARSGMSTW